MTYPHLPPEIAELRERTRRFIREVVVDEEPVPSGRLDPATRDRLQAAAKDAGVFAPLVPKEYGGQGLPIEHWSPILQEAGYSPIGSAALNCVAPDELVDRELAKTLSPRVQRMLGFHSQYPTGSPGLWQVDYADLGDCLGL
ncbi:acyl-CoA dehydrogenase family protein [Streptomyces sp. AC627_RSS907]|uniref:acyl-CoA dehydrogenase family protein n=1 Tax=Streptomyces sp. AC627_RSS907 TaxID=2823684 RepID=UPI0020B6AD75|nr:acyl-CoA dehydrogenase family protein [Streptomyces sp. AC627_RSS907]